MHELSNLFNALSRSKFRRRMRLGQKQIAYLQEKGLDTVMEHADRFVRARLAPAQPANDGKQTPFKNHPVFIAQHATATCCRGCLAKWHHIPRHQPLSEAQIQYILSVIRFWLENTGKRNSKDNQKTV